VQASFEKVPLSPGESFRLLEYEGPHFDAPWHFHPEYELTLIVESRGTRFVGDSVLRFEPGDLCLIGPNLPHCWLNSRGARGRSRAIVVQFAEGFLGQDFWKAPELRPVFTLLQRSGRGLGFQGSGRALAAKELAELGKFRGTERLLRTLLLLGRLASARDTRPLASASFAPTLNLAASQRIDRVYRHLVENFRKQITLSEVATIARLSPAAFCREFLKNTGKPLMAVVNEMRVGHACRLLIEGKHNASEACYESGFNNVAHYNRMFKRITKLTPSAYQKRFAEH
jgi:AraC-like DNA-binding protein